MKEVTNLEGVVCYIDIPHREGGDQNQTQSSTNPSLREFSRCEGGDQSQTQSVMNPRVRNFHAQPMKSVEQYG